MFRIEICFMILFRVLQLQEDLSIQDQAHSRQVPGTNLCDCRIAIDERI